MDGAGIAKRVAFGYGKAGSKLGLPHALYRPLGPLTAALDGGNRLSSLLFITSATADVSFSRPSKYGEAPRFGLFDSTQTRVGDYIDGPTGTYFIISQGTDEGPMVVECNAVVTMLRGSSVSTLNEDVYAGRTVPTDTVTLKSFPASVLDTGRMEAGRTDLPGDPSRKGVLLLLPYIARCSITITDRVSAIFNGATEAARSYTVDAVELSGLGWRAIARAEL